MTTQTSLVSRESYLAWKLRVASCSFLVCEQLETRNAKRERTNYTSRFTVLPLALALSLGLNLSLNLDLSQAASSGLADRVVEHKLTNGLTVLIVERHQTPVVSLNMTFRVGGVNEQVGQTGLAHLYEHMAFKGTRTVGTKDYEKERPILEGLFGVGTELDQWLRELARKGRKGHPVSRIGLPTTYCRSGVRNCKMQRDNS